VARTIFVNEGGVTRQAGSVDPAWFAAGSDASVWVDLEAPTEEEAAVLTEVFAFHDLSVEDALSEIHHPKVETYPGYLYVILHGIDSSAAGTAFATQDIDFFLGPRYLVTVHAHHSRSIGHVSILCARNDAALGEGPSALMHRVVDTMVDNYGPEVDRLEDRLEALERDVFARTTPRQIQAVLELKRDVATLRRVVLPERDVLARLSRREFTEVGENVTYRFRDVYDHLVRLSDEAIFLQDRTTGLLEAYLSTVSNRLNAVMKVLTVLSTIFLPLSVVTGLYGMNVPIPAFPGGPGAQFWWIVGLMAAMSGGMLWWFRRARWL
jgi:magnesium transporter